MLDAEWWLYFKWSPGVETHKHTKKFFVTQNFFLKFQRNVWKNSNYKHYPLFGLKDIFKDAWPWRWLLEVAYGASHCYLLTKYKSVGKITSVTWAIIHHWEIFIWASRRPLPKTFTEIVKVYVICILLMHIFYNWNVSTSEIFSKSFNHTLAR